MTNFSQDLKSNEELKRFLDGFYKQSDTKPPTTEDPYVLYFTEDATLIMGSTKVIGKDEIFQMRQNMWTKVTSRHHVVQNVASLSKNEILLNGYVEYGLINGKAISIQWAGHAVFEDENFQKMDYYQVYLDSAPMAAALSS